MVQQPRAAGIVFGGPTGTGLRLALVPETHPHADAGLGFSGLDIGQGVGGEEGGTPKGLRGEGERFSGSDFGDCVCRRDLGFLKGFYMIFGGDFCGNEGHLLSADEQEVVFVEGGDQVGLGGDGGEVELVGAFTLGARAHIALQAWGGMGRDGGGGRKGAF